MPFPAPLVVHMTHTLMSDVQIGLRYTVCEIKGVQMKIVYGTILWRLSSTYSLTELIEIGLALTYLENFKFYLFYGPFDSHRTFSLTNLLPQLSAHMLSSVIEAFHHYHTSIDKAHERKPMSIPSPSFYSLGSVSTPYFHWEEHWPHLRGQ